MLLSEPPRTPYDLNFNLAGIPVRVHPMFWLISTLLGATADTPPLFVLLWVVCVFVSILIHELGHALAARSYGWPPHITLYGFGGLASYRPTRRDPLAQILITIAGPLAGFVLAAGVVAFIHLAGFRLDNFFGFSFGSGGFIENDNLRWVLINLLYINIFWGLVNCLPIIPLDGGQITREVLLQISPSSGLMLTCQISMVAAMAVAALALWAGFGLFIPLFFGYLAYTSYVPASARNGC